MKNTSVEQGYNEAIVNNGELTFDVYDASTDEFIRTDTMTEHEARCAICCGFKLDHFGTWVDALPKGADGEYIGKDAEFELINELFNS